MSKEWDKKNMKTLSVNLKREEAEAFQELAKEHETTVGAMFRLYVQGMLADAQKNDQNTGLSHIVSYKNTDRLKHETAFHNPGGLNPNGILNRILDDYFEFVEKVRK